MLLLINLVVDELKYPFLFKGDEAVPGKDEWYWCLEEEHGDKLMCFTLMVSLCLNGSIVQPSVFLLLSRL